jgi:hypothetical protein
LPFWLFFGILSGVGCRSLFDDFGKVSDDELKQEERVQAWSGGRLGQKRARTTRRQLAGNIGWCEQNKVKDALTRRRGPRRRGKDEYSKVRARKQKKARAGAGAGAAGIEPETAIQRDRSVTKHPPKAAFAAI